MVASLASDQPDFFLCVKCRMPHARLACRNCGVCDFAMLGMWRSTVSDVDNLKVSYALDVAVLSC
jgi:hypothetical protein